MIHLPRPTELKTKWKTILAIIVAASASFSIGAFANQVMVQNVQSLAGTHVLVRAPELRILSTAWNINLNTSTITAVTLNVTTVSSLPTTLIKTYQIFVQVSCLNPLNVSFTCATGTSTIVLPANGGAGSLIVPLSPHVDPELIEVHDLSFIVTGTPSVCSPSSTITISPSTLTIQKGFNGSASIVITNNPCTTITECFTVAIAPSVSGGPTGFLFPSCVTIPPSGSATATLVTFVPTTAPSGSYTVTVTATCVACVPPLVQVANVGLTVP